MIVSMPGVGQRSAWNPCAARTLWCWACRGAGCGWREGPQASLDVLVLRKLGVPFHPELAFGGVGEGPSFITAAQFFELRGKKVSKCNGSPVSSPSCAAA